MLLQRNPKGSVLVFKKQVMARSITLLDGTFPKNLARYRYHEILLPNCYLGSLEALRCRIEIFKHILQYLWSIWKKQFQKLCVEFIHLWEYKFTLKFVQVWIHYIHMSQSLYVSKFFFLAVIRIYLKRQKYQINFIYLVEAINITMFL